MHVGRKWIWELLVTSPTVGWHGGKSQGLVVAESTFTPNTFALCSVAKQSTTLTPIFSCGKGRIDTQKTSLRSENRSALGIQHSVQLGTL